MASRGARFLRRMVPSLLVVRTTIGGPKIKRVVGPHVILQTKRNSHKAAGAFTGSGAGAPAISASMTPFANPGRR